MKTPAVICSKIDTLSPLQEDSLLKDTYPGGLLITGYFVVNETGVYDFHVLFTHALRIYLSDPSQPIFADLQYDNLTHCNTFEKYLESGEQWLRVIREVKETSSSFALWYRLQGTTVWIPLNANVLRQGGVIPSTLSYPNALLLVDRFFLGDIPHVSGEMCDSYKISPSLPGSIQFNQDGSLSGTLSVLMTVPSYF